MKPLNEGLTKAVLKASPNPTTPGESSTYKLEENQRIKPLINWSRLPSQRIVLQRPKNLPSTSGLNLRRCEGTDSSNVPFNRAKCSSKVNLNKQKFIQSICRQKWTEPVLECRKWPQSNQGTPKQMVWTNMAHAAKSYRSS